MTHLHLLMLAWLGIVQTTIIPQERYPLRMPDLRKREISKALDPCDGVGAEPVLYHNYTVEHCEPKFNVKDGVCDGWSTAEPEGDWCATYCQLCKCQIEPTCSSLGPQPTHLDDRG
jgi:hypothetical protein